MIELENVITANETAITTLTTEISGLESTHKKLKEALVFETKKDAEGNIRVLTDTANGQLSGKDKIMLETYV